MNYRVTATPEARADLLRLNVFLAKQSPDAARRAMDEIDLALRSLSEMPDRAAGGTGGVRELMIPFGGSGYVAQYRISQDTVIIARVFHMREDRRGADR